MKRPHEPPRHLCVVLLSGLGDVVNGLPAVNAIRDANPDLEITWVVEPMPAPLLRGHPSIDRVIEYSRRTGVKGIPSLISQLGAVQPIDTTINFNIYLKSVWPTLASRAPRRIGFDRARTFDGVWLASNERISPQPVGHSMDMFLEFAAYLGASADNPQWRIAFTDEELGEQGAFRERFAGKPVATVVPSSSMSKKDWLTERWATVVDSLAHDFGFQVVLAGGPGEHEQSAAREIVSRASAKTKWALGDSVRKLASIVASSDLMVAVDTGPVHIARALDVPVVGIYGHTNPWRAGPWRAYEDLWVDHYTEGVPDPSNRSPKWNVMSGITAQEVIEKIQVAMERYVRKDRAPHTPAPSTTRY